MPACRFLSYLFLYGGPCHIETSPLVYRASQWTGFYTMGTSVVKKLNNTFWLTVGKNGVDYICQNLIILTISLDS